MNAQESVDRPISPRVLGGFRWPATMGASFFLVTAFVGRWMTPTAEPPTFWAVVLVGVCGLAGAAWGLTR